MPRRHVHWHGLKWSLIGNAWDDSPKAAKVNVCFFFKKESAIQNMFSLDTQILHPQESNMSSKKGAISKERIILQPPSFQWLHWKKSHLELRISIFPSWWKIPKHVIICVMFIPRSWSKMADEKWSFTWGVTLHWSRFLATLKNHLCNPQQQKRNYNSNFFGGERLDGNKSNGKSKGH